MWTLQPRYDSSDNEPEGMSRSIRDKYEWKKGARDGEDVVLKWVERCEERYTNGNKIGSEPTLEVYKGPPSTVELSHCPFVENNAAALLIKI